MAAAWWTAPSPPTACSSRRRPGSCCHNLERDGDSKKSHLALEHASCLDEERKAIEFEVLFQTAPEQSKPSILRHVGELLARLRKFVFEDARSEERRGGTE